MNASRTTLLAVAGGLALAACSRPATQTTAPPLQPLTASTTPAAAVATPATAAVLPTAAPVPTTGAAAGSGTDPALAAAPPPANGYSCTFPGPDGRSILARFTVDGGAAHDDQGMAFNVLDNSPTALVLAHARDDLATAPEGDVGAYVVAIDRRTLGMVQSTTGLHGAGATRRGHCIAG